METRRTLSRLTPVIVGACLIAACMIVPPDTGASAPTPLPPSQPSSPIRYVQPDAALAVEVIEVSNAAREREGIPPLATSAAANRAAMAYAEELAARKEISHTSPVRGLEDPGSRLSAAGFAWTQVAENLALFSPRGGIAENSIEGWLKSSGHRRNLLNPAYTITGAGVASDERGYYYIVQLYATQ